jgi:NTE family protein
VHAGRDRALILHGGGSAGNAWEIGVAAGLLDAGVDVTDADLIVGTSAGATAAAQLTSASPTELVAAVLSQPVPERTGAHPPALVGGVGRGGDDPARPPTASARLATSTAATAATRTPILPAGTHVC